MPFRPRLSLAITLLLASCQKSPAPNVDQSPSVTPTPAAESSVKCDLDVRPGEALGPVRLGMTFAELEKLGLPIEKKSVFEATEFLKVGQFQVELCGGKVVEIWIEDLRQLPSCASFRDRTIAKDLPKEQVFALFSGCQELPPRKGGTFTECEGGGIRLGYGLGNFLQLRIAERGSKLDDSCEMRLDDGGPVALSPDALATLLQKTLDVDRLAPFWHSNLPGRDPLRVLDNDVVKQKPKLSMFGNPVSYVARATVDKDKKPYFEFKSVTSSATRTTIEFSYPVEGVIGKTVFVKRGNDWVLTEKNVAER